MQVHNETIFLLVKFLYTCYTDVHMYIMYVHLAAVLILTQDNFNGIRIFIIISYESIAVPMLCDVSHSICPLRSP